MASTISGSVQAENSRQGVEINGFAQVFASALPRILSNSTPSLVLDGKPIADTEYFDETVTTQISSKKLERAPNHRAEKRDLGVPKTHYDDTPFEEMAPLNPVTYVGDENWDVRYPVILDAVSPIDPGVYDGVLEPFAIRDIATRTNNESPFESRRVRGTWANAHEDLLGRSTPIEQRVYYEGYQGETRAYQEFGDNLDRPIDAKFTYFPDEPLISVPFEDSDDATLMASRVSDDSFVAVLEKATGSYTKFGSTFRSTNNGYTFRDTENGTDSLAFLDRLSYSSGSSPLNSRQRVLRRSSPVNIGFSDADTVSKTSPFDATRVIEGSQAYYPGAQSRSAEVSGYKSQDISTVTLSSLIQRNVPEISEDISHPEFKDDITKQDLLLPDGTQGKSFFKIDISSKASWDPAHEVYQLGPTTYDFRNDVTAHWNFETPVTGSGNGTVPDKSGNGHTGTLYGDASVDLNWAPGPITSRGNLNLERDSTNSTNHDYLKASDSQDFHFEINKGKTISLWVRPANLSGTQYVFAKINEYYCSINSSGNIDFQIDGTGGTSAISAVTTASPISANKWYHITVTYGGSDQSSISIYVNGSVSNSSKSSTGTFTAPNSSTYDLVVGAVSTAQYTNDFVGRIASFELWSKALTANEALAIYKLQLQGTQYMGRTDSRMASLTKTANWAGGSLFLSSAFRGVSSSFDRYNGHETGIAGTGFYYYSPFYKRWVEKRPDHATSISNSRYWIGTGGNTRDRDETGATNAIEVNALTMFTNDADFQPVWSNSLRDAELADFARTIASPINENYRVSWFSSKLYVTGTENILTQFSASPQLGYFLPYREHLERSGYENIGTPTVVFNAPNAPKYHAFDEETIKLSDYIDRPFLLRKMIVKVPVQLHRRQDAVSGSFGSGQHWEKDVTGRKDIDNYTFFLYRQRRLGRAKDSLSDISSSARFLIASSSVCVYNSSSFGLAQSDGFYQSFGSGTPLSQSFVGGLFTSTYLSDVIAYTTGNNFDPIRIFSLNRQSTPIHNPGFAVNAGLSASLVPGGVAAERYLAQGGLKLTSYPTVVLGSYPVSTLYHMTSSTAHLSTSFMWDNYALTDNALGDPTLAATRKNLLFNRYPYTGSFSAPNNKEVSPPITSIVQNFWYGGTRQPTFSVPRPSVSKPIGGSLGFKPYVQFVGTEEFFKNDTSTLFNTSTTSSYTEPTFDIELGRVGLSLFDDKSNIFEEPADIATDGRSLPVTLGKSAKPQKAGVFQRSTLITFLSQSSEDDAPGYGSEFTVGNLSGSSVSELVASLTVGYAPTSTNEEKQLLRDYVLMPSDELIFGLDAGVTPPPDVTPMYGNPRPDYQAPDYPPLFGGSSISPFSAGGKSGVGRGVLSFGSGRALAASPKITNNLGVTLGGQAVVSDNNPNQGGTKSLVGTNLIGSLNPRAVESVNADGSFNDSDGSAGGAASITSPSISCLGNSIDDFMKIVGWEGQPKGRWYRDYGSFMPFYPVSPSPRPKTTPFFSPIMRETLPHYSGNSYLRILHGEAEIILIGEYLADNVGKQVTRGTFSSDFTQTVGDNFIVDRFDNAEGDAFSGTYLADIVTGSFFGGTRGVAADGSSRTTVSGSNVRRLVKMSSDTVVIHDLFFSGVNESPATAYRNAPQLPSFTPSVLDRIIGGRSYASGSFFRGQAALRRKPSIKVSAQFRPDHWGYLSDLVEGVENTKLYDTSSPAGAKITESPVTVRFVSGNAPTLPIRTSSQNISKTSSVDTPYVDGQAVSRTAIDDEEIITT